MVYHWRMMPRAWAIAVAALMLPAWTAAQESGPDTPSQQEAAPDERQAEEREQMQKLRRAQAELEARRAEAARRLEGEQLRQSEMRRLYEAHAISRRESYLGGEVYWTQRERDSLQWKDPTDLSSMARRSNLDHQLHQHRNELDRAGTLRQGVTHPRTLNGLQLR
jgi:hypothetical protein